MILKRLRGFATPQPFFICVLLAMNYDKLQQISVISFSVILLLFSSSPLFSQQSDAQLDAVLNSAESFFKFIKKKDYAKTWSTLTQKSQDTIANDVLKEIQKTKSSQQPAEDLSKEQIAADFAIAGPLAKSYWSNFLDYVNPDIVLEQSKWDIGTIKGDRAEISVKYKKSDNPAILQMYKENNVWKLGLVETFWTRK